MTFDPMAVTVGAWAEFPRNHPLVPSLKARLVLPNPEYEQAQRLGFSTRGMAETVALWEESGGMVRFPRALLHGLGKAVTVVDERVEGQPVDFHSQIQLRPQQVEFTDTLEQAVRAGYGAVGQARPGFGKTITSLEIAARLGRPTLILVHKEFLMTQWVERILGTEAAAARLGIAASSLSSSRQAAAFGIHPNEVGLVQQDVCEYKGRKIGVAMAQSLVARAYPPDFYQHFGLIMVDEVHRFAAPVFLQAITKFPAKYRLGVTATPSRQDNMQDVFFSHIGPIAARGVADEVPPRVNLVATPVVMPQGFEGKYLTRNGRPDMVKVVTYLTEHEARNRFVIDLVLQAATNDRKVLILSARRGHLEALRELFLTECRKRNLGLSTAFYVGGLSLDQRKQAESMQVLFATDSMAREGLDIPALDTLFLVTRFGQVTQAVGRILRHHTGKKAPVVVDFVDTAIGLCRGLAKKRETEYRQQRWL